MIRYTAQKAILSKIRKPAILFPRKQSTEKPVQKEETEKAPSAFEEPDYPQREESARLSEFRKKLKEDIAAAEMNRYNFMTPKEDDPLPPWPDNVNPHTGEVGGPRGPEPTRYGDWERKGICVDF